jgi:hypothetical protein
MKPKWIPFSLVVQACLLLTAAACQWGIQNPGEETDADASDVDAREDRTEVDVRPDGDAEVPDADVPVEDGAEVPECTTSAQCDDGEPCNGVETCDAGGTCVDGTPLGDGTACTTRTGADGSCTAGVCVPASCGNGTVDDGEECDDGNATPGDGCEGSCLFSCHAPGDCGDDNVCTEDLCTPNAAGQACENPPAAGPCDDGLFCTINDACDGSGACAGAGDTCADTLECTILETCDEDSDRCGYDVTPGWCFVDGACYRDGDADPANECQECRSTESIVTFSPLPDMEICTGGICCGGACQAGGECCSNVDCPGAACTGTADPCDSITDGAVCPGQTGCLWVPTGTGVCTGSNACRTFRDVPQTSCTDCGCTAYSCGGGVCDCRGAGSACDTFPGMIGCEFCGCSWVLTSECTGIHAACDSYGTEATCNGQRGCTWSTHDCVGYACL